MKLYIKAISSYLSSDEEIDVKKELKKKYGVDSRRKDDFIHEGLLGALRLRDVVDIQRDNELYITSGFGNINILAKMNDYILEKHEYIKLFDFINMLGNTSSFYIASELGLKGKSIFEISDNFTYFHSLITIYASILKSKNEVVFGSIDIASLDNEVLKRVAGIDKNIDIASSVCYQKLSLDKELAICELEFDTKFYTLDEIKNILSKESAKIYSSIRCDKIDSIKPDRYFETYASFVVNDSILKSQNSIFIECYENKYKILRINPLTTI